jgi:hypothetical protein
MPQKRLERTPSKHFHTSDRATFSSGLFHPRSPADSAVFFDQIVKFIRPDGVSRHLAESLDPVAFFVGLGTFFVFEVVNAEAFFPLGAVEPVLPFKAGYIGNFFWPFLRRCLF